VAESVHGYAGAKIEELSVGGVPYPGSLAVGEIEGRMGIYAYQVWRKVIKC